MTLGSLPFLFCDYVPIAGIINPKAEGPFVADFLQNASSIGAFVNDKIRYICLPDIDPDSFEKPIAVKFDPTHELYNPDNGGWAFHVGNTGGKIDLIYAMYTADSPNEPIYQRYNPCTGLWVSFDPPQRPVLDFYSAFFRALIEQGHLALDVVGMLPLLGEIADVINGVWYLAEGNTSEGLLSFGALIPFADIGTKGGKYFLRGVDEAKDINKIVRKWKDSRGITIIEELDLRPVMRKLQEVYPTEALANGRGKELMEWLLHPNQAEILPLFLAKPKLVKAWDIMFSKQTFRTDVTLLQRMSDDIAIEPAFENFIRNNPSKLDGWKVWKGTYNSAGDPVKNVLGSGKVNNTDEWNQLIGEIEAAGGQVTFRSGDIAYAPGLKKGEPGQLIIDPDASITALRHEHRHFIDDQAAGFKGYEGVFDPNFRVTTEYNAYKLEVEEMLNMGQTSVANQLKNNFQNEVNDIMSKFGTADQSVLSLIDDLMNL